MTHHLTAETLVMLTTNFKPRRERSKVRLAKPIEQYEKCGRCKKPMDALRALNAEVRCMCPGAKPSSKRKFRLRKAA